MFEYSSLPVRQHQHTKEPPTTESHDRHHLLCMHRFSTHVNDSNSKQHVHMSMTVKKNDETV